MNKKKIAIIILLVALVLVTADALITNYMISHTSQEYQATIEMNPLMKSIAGTNWLIVVKSGWVIFCLVLAFILPNRKITFRKKKDRWCDIHNGL
jgi:uncharacterized membrane protein